jgi:rRNA maturation endonuclease Nob1
MDNNFEDAWDEKQKAKGRKITIDTIVDIELKQEFYPVQSDYNYCPQCRGSFSFSKPINDKCPWCGYILKMK